MIHLMIGYYSRMMKLCRWGSVTISANYNQTVILCFLLFMSMVLLSGFVTKSLRSSTSYLYYRDNSCKIHHSLKLVLAAKEFHTVQRDIRKYLDIVCLCTYIKFI